MVGFSVFFHHLFACLTVIIDVVTKKYLADLKDLAGSFSRRVKTAAMQFASCVNFWHASKGAGPHGVRAALQVDP